MPDLISLLSNASQSLSAAQGAVATASHNIQNVNTPGYSRQRAVIEASVPEATVNGSYIGRGSRLIGITQARDRFLEAQVHYTFAAESKSSALMSALDNVHIFDSTQPGGVGDAISGLFDSIRKLSGNPTNVALRDGAVNSAKALQTAFQRESKNIDTARSSLDSQVEASLYEVNNLAQKVASLNHQIVMTRLSTGSAPNDLMDQRQIAQDRLAELVGATPVPDSQGRVTLTLPQGGAIVAGERAGRLETFPKVSDRGHLGIRLVDQDGAVLDVDNTAISGNVGGYLVARDEALKGTAVRLDNLAFKLAQSFNTVHTAGRDLNDLNGQNLFEVGATEDGAATRFAVNGLIAADPRLLATRGVNSGMGDNQGALQLLDLERAAVTGSDSPVNAYARLTAEFGASTSAARAAYAHDRTMKEHLMKRRDEYSGVSVDEELIEMTKAQRAYEAIGKVIQTGDQMLKTLLDIK